MKWLRFLFGFFRKSKKPETPPKKTGLYYDNLPGACGHIFCTECSNIVLIDVWIHDYRKKGYKYLLSMSGLWQVYKYPFVKGR